MCVILAGRPERDFNPDLCDAGVVLYQLSYQLHPDHMGQGLRLVQARIFQAFLTTT